MFCFDFARFWPWCQSLMLMLPEWLSGWCRDVSLFVFSRVFFCFVVTLVVWIFFMPILIEGKGKGRAEAICTQGRDWLWREVKISHPKSLLCPSKAAAKSKAGAAKKEDFAWAIHSWLTFMILMICPYLSHDLCVPTRSISPSLFCPLLSMCFVNFVAWFDVDVARRRRIDLSVLRWCSPLKSSMPRHHETYRWYAPPKKTQCQRYKN